MELEEFTHPYKRLVEDLSGKLGKRLLNVLIPMFTHSVKRKQEARREVVKEGFLPLKETQGRGRGTLLTPPK